MSIVLPELETFVSPAGDYATLELDDSGRGRMTLRLETARRLIVRLLPASLALKVVAEMRAQLLRLGWKRVEA